MLGIIITILGAEGSARTEHGKFVVGLIIIVLGALILADGALRACGHEIVLSSTIQVSRGDVVDWCEK